VYFHKNVASTVNKLHNMLTLWKPPDMKLAYIFSHQGTTKLLAWFVGWFMVFHATFNNMFVISW